jgi:hypothetical protein
MDLLRGRMDVDYDAGYFDRDEQTWWADRVAVRVEGDTARVRQQQGYADRLAAPTTWEAAVVAVDDPGELATLSEPGGALRYFDLRRGRLLAASLTVTESGPSRAPTSEAAIALWTRRALDLRATLTGAPSADVAVERLLDDHGALVGVDLRAPDAPAFVARWRLATPETTDVQTHLPAASLGLFRAAMRVAFAGPWVRPALARATLRALAVEVGDLLSSLDRGASPDAWDRIAAAARAAAALDAVADDALDALGLRDAARAFAAGASSRWATLADATEAPGGAPADAAAVRELRALLAVGGAR